MIKDVHASKAPGEEGMPRGVGPRPESTEGRPTAEGGGDPDAAWTVQSSSKTRRLVPQHTLTRQELGADNSKSKPPGVEPPKRKVIRFTKDELLARRKEEKLLSSIAHMSDILSPRQDPVAFTKLDPDDVLRLWSSHNKETAARGRGRGRGRPGDEGTGEAEWAKNEDRKAGGDLWSSDFGADVTGDLSDLAAAALNFRSQLSGMALDKDGLDKVEEEDMMERLLKEQKDAGKSDTLGFDDADDLPAWATSTALEPEVPKMEVPASVPVCDFAGVSLVKALAPAPAPAPVTSAFSERGSKIEFALLDSAPISLVPEPRHNGPIEWLYMDPQGKIQGPFSQDNMRLWHEGGYFPRDLPIKLRHWNSFHAFTDVFEDLRVAFFSVPLEPRQHAGLLALSGAFGGAVAAPSLVRPSAPSAPLAVFADLQPSIAVSAQSTILDRIKISAVEPTRPAAVVPAPVAPMPAPVPVSVPAAAPQAQAPPKQAQAVVKAPKAPSTPIAASAPQPFPVAHSVAKSDFAKQLLGIATKSAPSASNTVSTVIQEGERPVQPVVEARESAPQSALVRAEKVSESKAQAKVRQQQAMSSPPLTTSGASQQGWNKAPAAAAPQTVSLAEIQQQEEEARLREQAAAPAPNMSAQLKSLLGVKSGSGMPWSTTQPAVVTAAAASLRDIMMEEESTVQQHRDSTRSTAVAPVVGSSWAAKTKIPGSIPPAPVPAPAARVASVAAAVEMKAAAAPQPPAGRVPASTAAPIRASSGKSEFGGRQMSKEMADWCSAQLKRINASDDMTLMHFCMSLGSATEIRETLSSYLGSSPQVTNFATEFIKYRDEGKRPVTSPLNATDGGAARSDAARQNSGFVSASKKKKPTGGK